MNNILEEFQNFVLTTSEALPEDTPVVKGYDFNQGIDYEKLLDSFKFTGFQSTNFGLAVEEINEMLQCKLQPISEEGKEKQSFNPIKREPTNCTIFLGFTSNLISAGTREVLCYLAEHNLVDVMVTTAGGIEEDFIKCLCPTYIGRFDLQGRDLRRRGINRTGNLLVPNSNYCKFEDWLTPIIDEMCEEQKQGKIYTPSKFIARLGKEIDNPESVYYWAYKNNIPVFCPALTDGSIGDNLFFSTLKGQNLILDIVEDIRLLNLQAMQAVNSGMIILGGGVTKHHICNANLMRNGANWSVFVNVASEFDGSDSGARPDEAISWGKIQVDAHPTKIYGEASFIFPLLVAKTFAPFQQKYRPK